MERNMREFQKVVLVSLTNKGIVFKDFLCRPMDKVGWSHGHVLGRLDFDSADKLVDLGEVVSKGLVEKTNVVFFPDERACIDSGYSHEKWALVGRPQEMSISEVLSQLKVRKDLPPVAPSKTFNVFGAGSSSPDNLS